MTDIIIYNEKEITKEELEKLQEQVKSENNAEIVEVEKNVYKKRLRD